MTRFALGRSSKLILGIVLTASLAGAALAAEAVRTQASDVAPLHKSGATPLPRAPVVSSEASAAEDAHAARVALFQQKVEALKSVDAGFWGRPVVTRVRSRHGRTPSLAPRQLSLPRHAAAPPVLLPAEQLRVEVGKSDADCLAQAVYFEARGEPAAGQAAVAQVVMNRTRSPYYPKSVCGVVFQGAQHAGCQFSFACDGSLRRGVRDAAAWGRAQQVAAKVLNGEDNEARLAPALNYHANYVRPKWASRLAKLEQIGRHIFYQAVGGLLPEGGKAPTGKPAATPAPAVPDRPLPAWA